MCGFLCVATRRPLAESAQPSRWRRDILQHRGPDSFGERAFDHAFVRHWRLSIVDLSNESSQPYGRDDGWLIYNGEIYDWMDIAAREGVAASGDTPLVHALCARGRDAAALERARGFYAYVFLTDGGRRMRGGRDPFGKKPLYYAIDDERGIAAFASEERAILDVIEDRRHDAQGLSEYFLYKQAFRGRTAFAQISQLPPGAQFEFDTARWTLHVDRTWDAYYAMPAAEVFTLDDEPALDTASVAERVDAELRGAMEIRIPRDVRASVALSGGVDSTLIAADAMQSRLADQIARFITIGFDDPASDESARARAIAAALRVTDRHTVVPYAQGSVVSDLERCIAHAGAPLEHPHALSYDRLSAAAAQYAKVLITGEGADELFLGYAHYAGEGASFAFREYLTAEEEGEYRAAAGDRPFDAIRAAANVAHLRGRALSSHSASRELELKSHLLTLLTRNDKMGMAHSVEIRAPFLDRRVLRVALALSPEFLATAGQTKRVIKRLFEARFPTLEPPARKIGFRVPFDEAFLGGPERERLRDYVAVGVEVIARIAGLRRIDPARVSPRMAWPLINLGIFSEQFPV